MALAWHRIISPPAYILSCIIICSIIITYISSAWRRYHHISAGEEIGRAANSSRSVTFSRRGAGRKYCEKSNNQYGRKGELAAKITRKLYHGSDNSSEIWKRKRNGSVAQANASGRLQRHHHLSSASGEQQTGINMGRLTSVDVKTLRLHSFLGGTRLYIDA